MRLSTWIAVMLIVAGLGDGLASSAIALCRPAPSQAACCCGSHCAKDATGPGMSAACCDMQRAPLRGAETSATSRNTAPSTPTVGSAVFAAIAPLPCVVPSTGISLPGVPESLPAPPLYDLFRSYRI